MLNLCKRFALLLPLALLSSAVTAMVMDGNAISGLPPDTVVALKLPSGATSTARTDAQGQVKVTREDDDDPNGLYIPRGSDGSARLTNRRTGAYLGDLNVSDAGVAISAVAPADAFASYDNAQWKFFAEGGVNVLWLEDLEKNVDNAAAEAMAAGFSTNTFADDDGYGYRVALGVAMSDGKPWYSKGSHQWRFSVAWNDWERFEGGFVASQPAGSITSTGNSDIDAIEASIGLEYFVCDNVGISGTLGWTEYDVSDSGKARTTEGNVLISEFDEGDSYETATFGVGVSYYFSEWVGTRLSYRYSFDEIGASGDANASVLGLDLILSF